MRLIDADKFAELMKRFSENGSFKEDCQKAYNSVYLMLTVDKEKYSPTAYNVDKVVAELEKQKICIEKSCDAISQEDCNKYTDCGLCIVDRAIDIVKRGGVE